MDVEEEEEAEVEVVDAAVDDVDVPDMVTGSTRGIAGRGEGEGEREWW